MSRDGVDALSGSPIGWAVLVIVLGVVTVVVALITSIGVSVILAWLIQFMGAFLFLHALDSRGEGHTPWKVVVSMLYVMFGFFLVKHPLPETHALTLGLTFFFIAEGVMDFVGYIQGRNHGASHWILFDGVVTLILGILMWKRWPSSSLRDIGIVVGLNMVTTGTTRLLLSRAAKDPQTA